MLSRRVKIFKFKIEDFWRKYNHTRLSLCMVSSNGLSGAWKATFDFLKRFKKVECHSQKSRKTSAKIYFVFKKNPSNPQKPFCSKKISYACPNE